MKRPLTPASKDLLPIARKLRKEMTKEERHLWYDFLLHYDVKFYRQKIIGRFICDFYCPKARLAVELDGSQHYTEEGKAYDEKRTNFFHEYEIEVLRVYNGIVNNNFRGVCLAIDKVVKERIQKLSKKR
jgi:very-short-patch-repair endonuclease